MSVRAFFTVFVLFALSSCGEPNTPSSLTTHFDGRVNTTYGFVSH